MIQYRSIQKQEYDSLVSIHLYTFKGFFLTSLGKEFLSSYYRACLNSPKILGVCAVDKEDQIVAFGIGTCLSKGFHKEILANNFHEFYPRYGVETPEDKLDMIQCLSNKIYPDIQNR